MMRDSSSGKLIPVNDWKRACFDNVTPAEAMVMLNQLQADVLLMENDLLTYCINQTASLIHTFPVAKPVAVLNRSYVRTGEAIEVTVGIALFESA